MTDIKYFDSAGVQIAYIDATPEPGAAVQPLPILLIHGFASNISMNWLLPRLGRYATGGGVPRHSH